LSAKQLGWTFEPYGFVHAYAEDTEKWSKVVKLRASSLAEADRSLF